MPLISNGEQQREPVEPDREIDPQSGHPRVHLDDRSPRRRRVTASGKTGRAGPGRPRREYCRSFLSAAATNGARIDPISPRTSANVTAQRPVPPSFPQLTPMAGQMRGRSGGCLRVCYGKSRTK